MLWLTIASLMKNAASAKVCRWVSEKISLNEAKPNIYNTGITVLGMNSSVPDGIVMGKNCVIYGRTFPEDYPDGRLESGKAVVREV